MRSGRNNKRHRGSKGQIDDPSLVPRADELSPEPYSRAVQTSHHSDSYRPPSTSSRASYDMAREPSSSRSRHEVDSWRPDATHDRYEYTAPNDGYRRGGGRDDYDVVEQRDTEGWGRSGRDGRYSHSREEWPQRYERSYSSSSYPEPSSWPTHPPPSYDSRSASYSHWGADDSRNHTPDDRGHDRAQGHGRPDRQPDREQWSTDQRREKSDQKWQSDAGWDSRRRDQRGSQDEPTRHSSTQESPTDDRSWEPAPSWRASARHDSRNDSQTQRSQNSHRNSNSNKNSKGAKKNQNQNNKQRRDWRTDDGNLNKLVFFAYSSTFRY